MATILTISHYIYLSRKERYQLFDQIPVYAVGISVPVWFKKGDTTEPAKEIFCKYNIFNDNISSSIRYKESGYDIHLPKNFVNFKKDKFNYFKLLDVKDRGCEELVFRQNTKLNINKKSYSIVHFVEIKPIEHLLETLTVL